MKKPRTSLTFKIYSARIGCGYESFIYLNRIAVCRMAVSFTLGVAIHPKREENGRAACPAMPLVPGCQSSRGTRRSARCESSGAAGVPDGTGRCAARASGRCFMPGSSGEVAGAAVAGA
jgi:hypothetical protein